MKTQLYGSLLAFGLLSAAFALNAQAAAPVERFTSHDTYYIYYGAWDSTLLSTVQSNGYKVVVVEPKNITRAQVADLQNGADNVSGNADDIRVGRYLEFRIMDIGSEIHPDAVGNGGLKADAEIHIP